MIILWLQGIVQKRSVRKYNSAYVSVLDSVFLDNVYVRMYLFVDMP